MKVFINGRFLTQHPTGVQYFAQEICKELETVIDFVILVPKNQPIVNKSLSHKVVKIGNLKGYLWEQVSLPKYMKKQKKSILINLCNLAPINLKNQIVTIHDLAFVKNKDWFSTKFHKVYNYIIPKIVVNSLSILTVSETVKKELINTYNLPNNKIHVVFNKISQKLLEASPKQPTKKIEPKQYFLMVGSNNPRKNFQFVEEIFSSNQFQEKLVIVGASHSSFNTKKTNNPQSNNVMHLSRVNSKELSWLYQNTKAVINPSFYEGFGIPNIEAMYFKVPLLCSDITVFKEVSGEYSSYFKLNDKNDFIHQLKTVETAFDEKKSNYSFFQSKNRAKQLKVILGL